MRRTSTYARRPSGNEIKMTPMIDVVFLLLVFFVWTASFQIVEEVLPSNLSAVTGSETPQDPNDPPPPEEDFPDIVIHIQWTGTAPSWEVNDVAMSSLAQIKTHLEQIAGIKSDAPVIIHPEKDVPLGNVIDVYDLSRLVGFEKVQFAASEEI